MKIVKLKKNEEFIFRAGRGPKSEHPYDTWFSGELLELEQSTGTKNDKGDVIEVEEKKDFNCSINGLIARLKQAALHRGKVVEVSRFDHSGTKLENSIIIRARDMSDEERGALEPATADVSE